VLRLVLLSVLIASTTASAQISWIEPEHPHQGETLTITYNPAAQGAKLKLQDAVYAIIIFFDAPNPRVIVKLSQADGVLRGKTKIEPRASYLKIRFVTRHDYDPRTDLSAMIYRQDGVPARGAYHWAIFDRYADALAFAQKEIELYPDDFAVYPDKWGFGGMVMKRDEKRAMIEKDMAAISAKPQPDSFDWLQAMAFGYLDLGNEDKARELLIRMIDRYPTSAGSFLNSFEHVVKNSKYKAEAAQWQRDLVERFPASRYARIVADLAGQPDFPFQDTQTVVKKWLEDEPDSIDARLALADASCIHHQNYKEAHAALEKAIQLLLAGEYWDGMGSLTMRRLYRAYSDQAEIFLDERNYPQALASAKAAEGFERGTDARSQILEGKVWQALSDNARAGSAYRDAWRRNPEQAEGPLRAFYMASRGTLDGFQEYLDAHRLVHVAVEEKKKKPAAQFQVVPLDGEPLSLASLRGKVIVLNFWFVGCAACVSEIPTLNRLVQEFKGQSVVFIAFALDHKDQLRAFLKKEPFSYKIVPDSTDIAAAFAVPSYPTHVLINQEGEIELKLTGNGNLGPLETQLKRLVNLSLVLHN
jgi:thiol-disulfide isomerase/thioredoxin